MKKQFADGTVRIINEQGKVVAIKNPKYDGNWWTVTGRLIRDAVTVAAYNSQPVHP